MPLEKPLEEYHNKRDFTKTPEPDGSLSVAGEASPEGPLHFVVQKHQASRLHYDFRLELDGVLKSWAVPKGLSLNPKDKKLAMMVEDHPYEYKDFEGQIPGGEYGAGYVIVWDEGTYSAAPEDGTAEPGPKESAKRLRAGLAKGHLDFVLHGHKLKGEFNLVKMKGKAENSWLLIKATDDDATEEDVLALEASVKSGETIEDLKRRAETEPNSVATWTSNRKPEFDWSGIDLSGAEKGRVPTDVEPMLASLAEEPFDRDGWLFEVKWDGFRALAQTGEPVRLISRHKINYEAEFPVLVEELKKVEFNGLLDGEIVVVDDKGRSQFRLLQNYRTTGQGLLVYYVFDILFLEGYDLRRLSLYRRKEILRQVLPPLPRLKYSDHVEEDGLAFFRIAVESGLEGILAKDKNSLYRPGVHSKEWLKVKAHHRQEAVIGGFTEPRGSRSNLGALLLGVYEGKDLIYVGHTGGGFDETSLAAVYNRLKPLVRESSPFKGKPPKTNAPATWIEPELVCEVRFVDWTKDGFMRQPIFLGMREDKLPQEVRRELPVPASDIHKRQKRIQLGEQRETMEVDGHKVAVTNPKKIFFPEEVITKGDVINYYREIASLILPHLVDRPESLNRHPNGIHGKHFFQKDVNEAPDWVKRARLESESEPEGIDYLICQDEATLIYMANLGCIEINPWNSRLQSLDNPDYLVMDLDPEKRSFDDVITVALEVRKVFEAVGAPNFVKTSGKTGLHIYVPLGGRYTYEQTRQFAQLTSELLNSRLPELTSTLRSPKDRQGKIYLDYLQNRRGQTMAAPYSLRPVNGAPFSAPLEWSEVRPGLSPLDFNLKNIARRLDKVGDLWVNFPNEEGMDMQKSLESLGKLWKKGK